MTARLISSPSQSHSSNSHFMIIREQTAPECLSSDLLSPEMLMGSPSLATHTCRYFCGSYSSEELRFSTAHTPLTCDIVLLFRLGQGHLFLVGPWGGVAGTGSVAA